MALARVVAARVVAAIRRGHPVLWTPDFMQLGNLLSLARTVHDNRNAGGEMSLLRTDALAPWLKVFPALAPLTVSRAEVRFTDQRLMPWSGEAVEQQDAAFDVTDTFDFIDRRLLTSAVFDNRRSPRDALVVNVRRGDYFSNPKHLQEFGFDTESYIAAAVSRSVDEGGTPARITIVSDDPGWCRDHLSWLTDIAPVTWGILVEPRSLTSSRSPLVAASC